MSLLTPWRVEDDSNQKFHKNEKYVDSERPEEMTETIQTVSYSLQSPITRAEIEVTRAEGGVRFSLTSGFKGDAGLEFFAPGLEARRFAEEVMKMTPEPPTPPRPEDPCRVLSATGEGGALSDEAQGLDPIGDVVWPDPHTLVGSEMDMGL